MGMRRRQRLLGFSIRSTPSARQLGLYGSQRAHARARHRRNHGNLQRGRPRALRAAAVSPRRTHRDDLGLPRRRLAPRRDVRHPSRARRTQPLVRRDRRHETVAADHDGRSRARAVRWSTRECSVFPRARRVAIREHGFYGNAQRHGGVIRRPDRCVALQPRRPLVPAHRAAAAGGNRPARADQHHPPDR